MTYAEKIEKEIRKKKVLEIGEVKLDRAYLYGGCYEIVLSRLPKRKVILLEMYQVQQKRRKVVEEIGTLNYVLGVATGYVRRKKL